MDAYYFYKTQGITNKKILRVIRHLPRELFVSDQYCQIAYENSPLPIGCGQTISQPFIVVYMTEKLELKKTDKVLEIGTGSGFQTGVLAQLTHQVYTIETYAKLSRQAQLTPFNKIIVTAVAQEIPSLLVGQLKMGGKMILPLELSDGEQYLILLSKLMENKIKQERLIPVRFVPLL
ncbi:6244_t:CDS:2 [Funneliformis geosporum]|nr:6244_t:CDS:2 [Funneliformis geosporum]